jgi:hypothetical protein
MRSSCTSHCFFPRAPQVSFLRPGRPLAQSGEGRQAG